MATHNQVRAVGFLREDPIIMNAGESGAEKVMFTIRTIHRDVDNFHGKRFQDLMVFYDGTAMIERMKKLVQFDLVDIKGVFNILTLNKKSHCPACGTMNVKYNGTATFVYPTSLVKINAVREAYEHSIDLPERILETHYMEVSNQVLIIGTVVSDPELLGTEKNPCCRYRLGVDRKYYIKTQGDISADYPWVYSYGQQAEMDYRHLQKGALILVDAFMQYRPVETTITCERCGIDYNFQDQATEFVPYSIEYLNNYKTDEEIAREESIQERLMLNQAKNDIFGEN
ncbi:single-stranded DNA-binding protein [Dorea amylophila]|uniref:single-stranded DNA-binding protein n=1 Tax=Dorea amylophila TaxID=2981789 RepID=UPI0022E66640|nr:single-stranded DNA-binding protein [Dorea amylophila]